MDLLGYTFYDNSLKSWLFASLVTVGSVFALHVFKELILYRLRILAKRTKTRYDDMAVDVFERTKAFLLLFIAIYLGSLYLTLPKNINHIVISALIIGFILQTAIWVHRFISVYGDDYIKVKTKASGDRKVTSTIPVLVFIAKFFLWGITTLIVMANLGIDVNTLIAGLGVGRYRRCARCSKCTGRPFCVTGDSIGQAVHYW